MTPEHPVVEWDFGRSDWLRPVRGDHELILRQGAGAQVTQRSFAGRTMAAFDGEHDFLTIKGSDCAALDVGKRTGQVSVLAWVVRTGGGLGFIGGLWQEHDDDARRQYGLFCDLGLYGGAERVAGHVSRHGGASAGLPYSKDACASARMIEPGTRRLVAFTFDGEQATAYLDGIADARPRYVDPAPPYGTLATYPKNPYRFPAGLNTGAAADFTVGAVLLSRGMGNFHAGGIASLAIFDRALTAAEIATEAVAGRDGADPMARLGFWRASDALDHRPDATVLTDWPLAQYGWHRLDADTGARHPVPRSAEAGGAPAELGLGEVGVRRDATGGWLVPLADARAGHARVTDRIAVAYTAVDDRPLPSADRLTFRVPEGRDSITALVRRGGAWEKITPRWDGEHGEVDLRPAAAASPVSGIGFELTPGWCRLGDVTLT